MTSTRDILIVLQKIDCLHNSAVMELMRGLRNQLTELITGLGAQDLGPMSLGLSHSLSRYKLKFSPEKVSLVSVPLPILLFMLLYALFLAFIVSSFVLGIMYRFPYCTHALLFFDCLLVHLYYLLQHSKYVTSYEFLTI
jgi:hypothetical protein